MDETKCPDCGGELKYKDYTYHVVHRADYLIPESIEIDYYIYECRECGKIIKSKKEL
jgi:uncharacterized C2H2 Zn-finger protein